MIVNLIYPIGRTITTLDNADNPNTLYPWQTWERAANGRFLLGADDNYAIGSEGGEAGHTLTVDEMPSHLHDAYYNWDGSQAIGGDWKIRMVNTTNGGVGILITRIPAVFL